MGTICNLWWRRTTDWRELSRPLSRLLVLLTTVLLLVMPITEHLCNWDKFLRGGPDVEFSLLAGLLFAAMVVLSMNGTMLQPGMLRPTVMQPAYASRTASFDPCSASAASGRNAMSPSTASNQSRKRWLDEPASAFDSGRGSGAAVPMRI
ncbi:MAG TPA: hypothetical protein VGY94_06125 [Acidobacteriaceae bacterium]|nr:hypothetical protein [Acidobacteriaceae bacterium]